MPRAPFTPEYQAYLARTAARIRALWEKGAADPQIADAVCLTPERVCQIRNGMGLRSRLVKHARRAAE